MAGVPISFNPASVITDVLGQIFQAIMGSANEQTIIRKLLNEVRWFQTAFKGMAAKGMFGSQVQRRMVGTREIWEQIGYAEPAEIPHLFALVPAGTTFTVRDEHPERNYSLDWLSAGYRGVGNWPLRWPDGAWYGTEFPLRAGTPPETIPRVGERGVRRVDYPPLALQAALNAQSPQYLGPRPLGGDEAAGRRAAFRAGGGDPVSLWMIELDNQVEREGRPVRAWTGKGWISDFPSKPLFEHKYSDAYHSGYIDKPLGLVGGMRSRLTGFTLTAALARALPAEFDQFTDAQLEWFQTKAGGRIIDLERRRGGFLLTRGTPPPFPLALTI